MGTAFRQSFHPVDVRADLAALPWLVTHTYALWVPILITVAGGIAVALTNDSRSITSLMYDYFVRPPAIGGVFIAGFLAPRASWLLGLIVGLVSALVNALLVTFVPLAIFSTAPDAAQAQEFIVSGFLLSPIFGALFASGAAWYRRFLQLSNPNRGRRAEVKKSQRRQVAHDRQGPEGRRSPLTDIRERPENRRGFQAEPAHPGVTELADARRDRLTRRPVPPPRGVAGSRGRSR